MHPDILCLGSHNQSTGEEEETHLEDVNIKDFGLNDASNMGGRAYDSDDEQSGGQQKVQCRQVSEKGVTCLYRRDLIYFFQL